MANQGCPNEGTDTRLLGKWGCKIQTALSFKTPVEPLSILIAFPFFVAINIPISFRRKRYLLLRAGFRYDKNWPGYIFPEAAIKVLDHTVMY